MLTARYALGVAAVNGMIHAIGGCCDNNMGELNTVEAYDRATDTWSTKTLMPTPRQGLGVAAVKEIVFAIDGVLAATPLNTVEAYDALADQQ